MPIEYGVTDNGFVIKPLSVIKAEIEEDLKASFGEEINLFPESEFAQFVTLSSIRHHELWELMQDIYNSGNANTASGTSLENILDINSLEKIAARPSIIIKQVFFGTVSTLIEAGTLVSVLNDSNSIFETDEDVTLAAGTDEIQTITFTGSPSSGIFTLIYNETETTTDLNYNATNTEVQNALNALSSLSGVTVTGSVGSGFIITFSGNDGKQPQPILIVGSNTLSPTTTISIVETTPGVYQGYCSMTCIENGPVNANAKTLTVIESPLSGFTRTFNIDDSVLGRFEETDAEARIRRVNNLTTSTAGPINAIINKIYHLNDDEYSDLIQLEFVDAYENVTDVIDSRNIPGHSIMVCVRQIGDSTTRDDEILQAIFDSKGAGIGTSFGNDLQNITFDNTPTSGNFTLEYVGQITSSLPYNATYTQVQTALNNLSNLSGVIVTGTIADGFIVEFAGNNSGLLMELLIVDSNTLSPATNITIERDFTKFTGTVYDITGKPHIINCARPNEIEISLILDNFTTDNNFPSDGIDQVKTAIVTWGNSLGVGKNIIIYPKLVSIIGTIDGILDFNIKIGKKIDGVPTLDDNVIISDGTGSHPEFSSWSTSDITINT